MDNEKRYNLNRNIKSNGKSVVNKIASGTLKECRDAMERDKDRMREIRWGMLGRFGIRMTNGQREECTYTIDEIDTMDV